MEHRLYTGNKFTGVSVRPDPKWPGMWRVHQGDKVSDMVNLTRAKDAAVFWATPPEGGLRNLNWHHRET